MAYSSIAKPTDYFNTVLYTGNGSAGHSITGVGFQPDWVWIKNRASAKHMLYDAARGATKAIFSNESTAENTSSGHLTAFGTDGFTLGDNSGTGSTNGNSENYASWNWKGGTTSGLSGGDITPSAYSYDATSGFGVYKYTGNGSADQTIPHGLGAIPQLIFYKRLDSSTNWVVQSNLLGNRVQLVLNGTDAENTDSRLSDSDNWTSTFFKVGSYGDMNNNSSAHVAYVFCNVKGYCKIGKYTGNGNADGTFIYTGFRPAWILLKQSSASGAGWRIHDTKRGISGNPEDETLYASASNAESTGRDVDFLSNGFKLRTDSGDGNSSGSTYIYMAFAENPFVANDSGTAVPVVAR
jgi:hypothetical protein